MTNIEEKIKNKCWERGYTIHDLDMDNIITQLDTIKKKYNKDYNDIVNECEVYLTHDIVELVQKTIDPNIYPKPESPDLMITYEINIECCLINLIKANIIQYYITIRNEDLYLCKVIK